MRSVLLALAVGATLAACASPSHPSGTDPGGPASDPAGRPTTSPTGSVPAPTSLTGTVVQGAEPSCLILRTPRGDFELLTDRRVSAGQRVAVTGHVAQVMSHCMQGTPFQVSTLTVK